MYFPQSKFSKFSNFVLLRTCKEGVKCFPQPNEWEISEILLLHHCSHSDLASVLILKLLLSPCEKTLTRESEYESFPAAAIATGLSRD